MDYFPKTEMSHLLPANSSSTSINYTPDFYSAYADSFDLSLLSSDDRETSLLSSSTSTQSEINKYQSLSPSSIGSESSPDAHQCDYIPTTIFNNNNDQTVTFNNNNNNTNQIIPIIKTEKLWNCDSTTNQKNSTIIDNNNYNINSPPPNYNNSNHQQNFGQEDYTNANTAAAASLLFQQLQKHYQFYPSPLPSPPQYEFCNLNSVSSSNNYSIYSPASSTLSPSPCPSLDQQLNNNFGGSTNCLNNNNSNNNNNTNILTNFPQVKQEYLILPPSPPESNGSPSPSLNEIKSEPGDNDIETNFIDINTLLERTLQNFEENQKKQQEEQQQQQKNQQQNTNTNFGVTQVPQDHQLLREYLQDTTFQKKHNLKPLALESLIGGLGVRGDIEPVISLALEHAKRDAQATCAQLQISPDPQQWTATQVHAWIRSTIEQFKLQEINELELKFSEDGINLLCLSEEEFIRRVPESGATIHAQLEIWKLACCENFQMDMFPAGPSTSTTTNNNNNNNNNKNNWPTTNDFNMDFTDDENDDMEHQTSITALNPTTTTATTTATTNISNENGQLTTSTTTTASINNNNNTTGTVSPLTIGQQQQQINPTTGTTSPTLSTTTVSTNNTNTQQTTTTPTPTATTTKAPRTGGSHIHLWQFLKELLASPQVHGTAIRWLDRNKGVFKIEDSVRVAKLWGRRKNRPAMNYDKLSRSIRQYYKKGIMKKTERSQRLVYQFCHPYSL